MPIEEIVFYENGQVVEQKPNIHDQKGCINEVMICPRINSRGLRETCMRVTVQIYNGTEVKFFYEISKLAQFLKIANVSKPEDLCNLQVKLFESDSVKGIGFYKR